MNESATTQLFDPVYHKEVTPQAMRFYDESQEVIFDLAMRWQDESEYEDINTYKLPLQPIAEQCGVKIEKMCKRPFGCEYSVDGKRFRLSITLSGKGNYSYKRIG